MNQTLLNIDPTQLDFWFIQPEKVPDNLLPQYRQLINAEELTRIHRYRFAKDQRNALITRAFIRCILAKYLNTPATKLSFGKNKHDKPFLLNNPQELTFNLSHTDGLIACAIHQGANIGCDVENSERNNDVLSIANRYFSTQEVTKLFSLPRNKQQAAFFHYWTLKEAYIKACGQGLAISLQDFSFHLEHLEQDINQDIAISFAQHRNDRPEHWQHWLFKPNNQHTAAISLNRRNTENINLRYFEYVPLTEYQQHNQLILANN